MFVCLFNANLEPLHSFQGATILLYFHEANFVCFSAPNYYQLHKINKIVQDTKVVVDFSLLLDEGTEEATREKGRILQDLLDHNEFVQARDYARLLQLPEDHITLKEVSIHKMYAV